MATTRRLWQPQPAGCDTAVRRLRQPRPEDRGSHDPKIVATTARRLWQPQPEAVTPQSEDCGSQVVTTRRSRQPQPEGCGTTARRLWQEPRAEDRGNRCRESHSPKAAAPQPEDRDWSHDPKIVAAATRGSRQPQPEGCGTTVQRLWQRRTRI